MPCAKVLAFPEGSSASVAKVMTGMAWLLCDRLRYRERRSEAGPLLNLLCLSGFRGAARDAARTTWIAVEHVNRGNDFDAHGDRSAPRTDQARNMLIIAPRACSAPIESGGFSWGRGWERLSALIRFWEAGRCQRPILGRCGSE